MQYSMGYNSERIDFLAQILFSDNQEHICTCRNFAATQRPLITS
jgi:hypothetical protein